jgi:chromosome segregation ATPase
VKCKCKLDLVVLEVAEDCPVHKEVTGLQLERLNILAALGEHPDSPVDIPQRISDIRDEGRAHFHKLTNLRAEYMRLQGDSEATDQREHVLQKKIVDLAGQIVRLFAAMGELKRRNKKFEDEYVHEKLLLDCQDKLLKAEEKLALRNREHEQLAEGLSKRRQPLALNCTICGANIHTDSFHAERCPQGYRSKGT